MNPHIARLAAALAIAAGSLALAPTPAGAVLVYRGSPPGPHVMRALRGGLRPAAGYAWVTGRPGDVRWMTGRPVDLRVAWSPGRAHPDAPNVVAGAAEGRWSPAVGYEWLDPAGPTLRVVPVGLRAERERLLEDIDRCESDIDRWREEIPEYQRIARESDSLVDKSYYGGMAVGLARNIPEHLRAIRSLKARLDQIDRQLGPGR